MVLNNPNNRTPEEQVFISQFYSALNEARRSPNYHDFEAANHLHNLSCELSLPQPSHQRTILIRYVREIEWERVSSQFRPLFQQFAGKLLEEI